MKKFKKYYPYIYQTQCSWSLLTDVSFHLLSPTWRICFCISYTADLLATNFPRFYLSENLFSCLHPGPVGLQSTFRFHGTLEPLYILWFVGYGESVRGELSGSLSFWAHGTNRNLEPLLGQDSGAEKKDARARDLILRWQSNIRYRQLHKVKPRNISSQKSLSIN